MTQKRLKQYILRSNKSVRRKLRINKKSKKNKKNNKSIFKGGMRIKQKKNFRKISKRGYKFKRNNKFIGGSTAKVPYEVIELQLMKGWNKILEDYFKSVNKKIDFKKLDSKKIYTLVIKLKKLFVRDTENEDIVEFIKKQIEEIKKQIGKKKLFQKTKNREPFLLEILFLLTYKKRLNETIINLNLINIPPDYYNVDPNDPFVKFKAGTGRLNNNLSEKGERKKEMSKRKLSELDLNKLDLSNETGVEGGSNSSEG